MNNGPPGEKIQRPVDLLVLLLTRLFAATLTCQSLFRALLLAWFQVKRMALHFLDDVFLLHFALETTQSVFQALTILNPYFRQTNTPPNQPELDLYQSSYAYFLS